MAWNGAAGSVRCGKSCLGEFRQGAAGEVRLAEVRCGMARYGKAGEAWQGEAGHGEAGLSQAGLEERRNQHGVPMENPNRAGIGADGRRRV